jgi:hypothetical protein
MQKSFALSNQTQNYVESPILINFISQKNLTHPQQYLIRGILIMVKIACLTI